jgi:hypothetical protein
MRVVATRKGTSAPDYDASELYGLELSEFTAARDALAKGLRSDGDRAAADEVKALRKPSVPAGAINRGVRADRKAAKELLAAGKALRAAHERALGGGDADALRQAMGEEAAAVEAMARAAAEAAGDEGLAPAMLDRVRDTLRAVAGDEDLREAFEAGRVERDQKPVGLGGSFAPAAGAAKAKPRKGPTAAQRRKAEQRVSRARKALDAARRQSADATAELEEARRAFKEAENAAGEAERAERLAREELEAAEAEGG